jgi:AcrR family transcriptional regulator
VFRERGFHATSIGDLSAATGLAVGSIYKAFKDKRALFRAVFDRYVDERNDELQRLLGQSTLARDKVEVLLRFYARSSQGQEGSYGCLVVGSVATLSTLDADMARHVRTTVHRLEARLRQLLRQGQVDCSIPRHLDIKSTATMLMAMVQGFRVLGKTCRTGRDMQRVVDQLMSLLA